MTGQLALLEEPEDPRAHLPGLTTWRGQDVNWRPWTTVDELPSTAQQGEHGPGCDHCGHPGPRPTSSGSVTEWRRLAKTRRRDGYGYASLPDQYEVLVLLAFLCEPCGAVDVLAHADPEFYWTAPSVGQDGRLRPRGGHLQLHRDADPAHVAALRAELAAQLARRGGDVVMPALGAARSRRRT